MHPTQKLSILFYLRRAKINAQLKAPIFARVTIDGIKSEIATGVSISPLFWDMKTKTIMPPSPDWKANNCTLRQLRSDLESHFNAVQTLKGTASPSVVIDSYKAPSRVTKAKDERNSNQALSNELDEILDDFFRIQGKSRKFTGNGSILYPEKANRLLHDRYLLERRIEKLTVFANEIMDNKHRQKTLMLAIDEQLLNFLQLTVSGSRSSATLEKMWGRKRRVTDFLMRRYKELDIPLEELNVKFLDQFKIFNLFHYRVAENSATRYLQALKETINRCVLNGWITSSMFDSYKCKYEEPTHDWLTMQEVSELIKADFAEKRLSLARDLFVFCSFTGLSYSELRALSQENLFVGIDGEKWMSISRQKTDGDETLPILPIPLKIIDHYRQQEIARRRNAIFPVPSNQELNRNLKEIGALFSSRIKLTTHKARFFFANEVAYNNGVEPRTISRMMGQKSVRSVETYIKANKTAISRSMMEVKSKLFDDLGQLRG